MKNIPEELVGKRLASVVLRKARSESSHPRTQLFLCFDDGTSFEFWCDNDEIHPAGGLDSFSAETLDTYMGDVMKVVRQAPSGKKK